MKGLPEDYNSALYSLVGETRSRRAIDTLLSVLTTGVIYGLFTHGNEEVTGILFLVLMFGGLFGVSWSALVPLRTLQGLGSMWEVYGAASFKIVALHLAGHDVLAMAFLIQFSTLLIKHVFAAHFYAIAPPTRL